MKKEDIKTQEEKRVNENTEERKKSRKYRMKKEDIKTLEEKRVDENTEGRINE